MRGTKPRLVVSNDLPIKVPAPPAWLSKEGRAEWRRVAGDLIGRGTVVETDLAALEAYCAAVAGVRETARIITRQGRMVGKKPHPAVRMQIQYLESSRRFAAELGLTPVSRSRRVVAPPPSSTDNDDPLAVC
jgi:P27 family predicted phage terminase small subunit